MGIYETHVEGCAIRSLFEFTNYMPGLTLAIVRHLEWQPQEVFLADFVKIDAVFPATWAASTRRQRIENMLHKPVQVGEALLSIESPAPGYKRAMYEKTKRVVLEWNVLPVDGPVIPWAPRSQHPVVFEHDKPLRPWVEEIQARLDEALARIAVLEAR